MTNKQSINNVTNAHLLTQIEDKINGYKKKIKDIKPTEMNDNAKIPNYSTNERKEIYNSFREYIDYICSVRQAYLSLSPCRKHYIYSNNKNKDIECETKKVDYYEKLNKLLNIKNLVDNADMNEKLNKYRNVLKYGMFKGNDYSNAREKMTQFETINLQHKINTHKKRAGLLTGGKKPVKKTTTKKQTTKKPVKKTTTKKPTTKKKSC